MSELFPNFQSDPAQFSLAEQFWKEVWASVCTSAGWQTGWLNTAMRDGTPFMDGDGILSGINRSEAKAFKVIQRPALEASEVHTWSTWSDIEDPPVRLTVVAGPLTERTRDRFREELKKMCR